MIKGHFKLVSTKHKRKNTHQLEDLYEEKLNSLNEDDWEARELWILKIINPHREKAIESEKEKECSVNDVQALHSFFFLCSTVLGQRLFANILHHTRTKSQKN